MNLAAIIIDAADLDTESTFWQRLLGGTLTRTATHHFIQIADSTPFVIQLAPGHVPPAWPAGSDQQVHVDLRTEDLEDADRCVLDAGGRRLAPLEDVNLLAQESGRVYASPAGHPLCLRAA